ncbi:MULTISPECIES: tetratricopeptide repeat protein [unclassified Simplicispira]|uniref:YfgM family protein n=1 Tax=unclassified Simplicispira TaxID=2630407 RepID=UPI000D5E062C|nr:MULTISPECIES: tetratricopeptide repeat protein [unclassified Simplicispira]PVY55415.1 putative negative regulator of RcsB-dependent stress response [Simplicispira sp. 125]REG16358.1 putative negative regulator of RcsB-dependent stress response [Simplicispira sp. 110]
MANHLDLEEQEQLDQLKHFWNTWGTLISSVLLVVVSALAAWNGYQFWQARQATQAAALYDAVEVAVASGDQGRWEQAFSDLRGKYAGTIQASQAGFLVSKMEATKGNLDAAKSALTWIADHAADDGHKELARIRLSGLLMAQQSYDEALQRLSAPFSLEYAAVVADRKGDVLALQGKRSEAVAEYLKAYKAFPDNVEYRRLVEIKLNALGERPQAVAIAAPLESSK